MKKKVLALVLGIALTIQPFSTVIAAELQNGAETETINEIETNVKSQEEIDVTKDDVVLKLENDVIVEDSTEKKLKLVEEKEDSAVAEEAVENKDVSVQTVEEDTEKPIIHCDTLTIDKTEATVGDTVKFSVKVTDASEMEKVLISFKNLDNNQAISYKKMIYNTLTDKYEYSLEISELMVAGHWQIESIAAYDIYSNNDYEFPTYHVGEGIWNFYIKNDNVDSKAPVIDRKSLKINKTETIIGEELLFSVKVTDNTHVDRVRIEISKDTEIFGDSYDMVYNSNTGLYEYKLKIDDTWIGHWYVSSLYAYDTTNNYSYNIWRRIDDDVVQFVVSENGEINYDCEVVNLKCTSGETAEYSYSYSRNDSVTLRIFDKSIVGYIQQSYGVSNIGYEIGGVFTPYKEGKTTVEVYSVKTGDILKVYKIEVLPKEHFVCNEMGVKGTFLTSTKQNYSVLCDNQKIDADVRLIRSSEIIVGSDVTGQYEYEYNFAFNENGNKKVSIVGETDNKEITLNVNVNSHDYSNPIFTWNADNSCTATYSCENCNKTEANQVCVVTSKTTEATCTTAGKTVYKATIDVNGIAYTEVKEEIIPALGHLYGEPVFTWNAEGTCVVKFECSICGDIQNPLCKITSETKDPVCIEDGTITYTATCVLEGKEYKDSFTKHIEALGHEYSSEWIVDKEPTCTEAGSKSRHCIRCDVKSDVMSIKALGHEYSLEWTVDKESTCTEAGSKSHHCMRCEEKADITSIPKISHSWDLGIITKEPTSTETGIRTYTCTFCGEEKTETISVLVDVAYRTHVQYYGWQNFVSNGTVSGTSGESKRLEGIEIKLNTIADVGIQYTTQCQTYGWLPWSSNGEMSGTQGEAKRLEAIKIQLTGSDKDEYNVYYRVHAQDYGWMNWAQNGEAAGTAGYSKRLEAIQIVVLKKGTELDKNLGGIVSTNVKAYVSKSNFVPTVPGESQTNVHYQTHVQSLGWQNWKCNGQMAGTSGQAKRLEGIKIYLSNKQCDGGIAYKTHVQNYGWMDWQSDGVMSGTSNESKRLEAIQIKLTGEMKDEYDVYYRVHAQTFGWLDWAKNGESAGTEGYGFRLEGIEIRLVKKGQAAPGKTQVPFRRLLTKAQREAEAKAEAKRVVNKIINKEMDQMQKAIAICDYLYNNVSLQTDQSTEAYKKNYGNEAYAALILKKAACSGYCKAVTLMCNEAGLESQHINANKWTHQWNLVKIDGKWYVLDAQIGLIVEGTVHPYV